MSEPRDYWLSLAVYDGYRGVPVRKVIARQYVDLTTMERERQADFIRLGSLFFQGRSWRKFAGHTGGDPLRHLTPEERDELLRLRALRLEVGAACLRLLDDDDTVSASTKDATLERLESMGFLADGE
jgi:hypothetical protein